MNPIAERFVGSLRREALDHVLLVGDDHLGRVGREYVRTFNEARPHQGIGQRIPAGPAAEFSTHRSSELVRANLAATMP